MGRIYVPIIIFFFLVLQGVAVDLLPNFLVSGSSYIIAHWVFIMLVLVTIYFDDTNSYYAVIYGLVYGLLLDIVYTDILGIYMFTYTLIIYLIHTMKNMITTNFYSTVTLGIIGVVCADILIYIIYLVVGWAQMSFSEYVFNRLLPTTLANIIFLILCYPIFRNRLLKWRYELTSKSSSF